MNKKNTAFFVVGGEQQSEAIHYARRRGYFTVTVDNAPGNAGHKVSDRYIELDVYDTCSLLEVARAICPRAVFNFVSSHGIESAIAISEELGLRGIGSKAYDIVNSKSRFRRFLAENGYPSPRVIYSSDDLGELPDISNGFIAKPEQGGGSRGICRLTTREDVQKFLESDTFRKEKYLIEELIDADFKLNGDCVIFENKIVYFCVGDYHYDPSSHEFVSYGTSFPSGYNNDNVRELVGAVVKDLNYGTGALNFEILVRGDECYFIEINPRHSGNYLHEVMRLQYGLGMAEANFDVLVDDEETVFSKVSADKVVSGFYAVGILFSQSDGMLKEVRLSNSLKSFVKKSIFFKKPGDQVNSFESLYDRVALLVMEFRSRTEMDEIMRDFNSHYDLVLEEGWI